MNIINEPYVFTKEQIDKICEIKEAEYVCDTTLKNGADCSVFYGKTAHPVSNSRYFGLYQHPMNGTLYICDGSSVEDLEITGVIANNGDVIYSRTRHDYRYSPDGSVWIDGGRDYARSGVYSPEKFVKLHVVDGKLKVKDETC
jgi:hypothetical protein